MCPDMVTPAGGLVEPVQSAPAVGFVGLGQMGALMAERLLGWPGGLTVYDARAEAATPFAERGAAAAGSVEELAGVAEIISVMVVDDEQVESVVEDALAHAARDTILAVHSTIRAGTARSLAARCAERGVTLLDAPVSGGAGGAATGRLALLVGGDQQALERCLEPFGRFAEIIVHFGPVGAGTEAKVARNLINFVGIAAALEATRLAEAAGVNITKLARVARHSDAITGGPAAVMVRDRTTPLELDDPLRPIFDHTRSLGEKDLALALDLGRVLGVDLPLAEVAVSRLAEYLGVPHEEGTR